MRAPVLVDPYTIPRFNESLSLKSFSGWSSALVVTDRFAHVPKDTQVR